MIDHAKMDDLRAGAFMEADRVAFEQLFETAQGLHPGLTRERLRERLRTADVDDPLWGWLGSRRSWLDAFPRWAKTEPTIAALITYLSLGRVQNEQTGAWEDVGVPQF
jgi:hypothetical protein